MGLSVSVIFFLFDHVCNTPYEREKKINEKNNRENIKPCVFNLDLFGNLLLIFRKINVRKI